MNRPVEPIPPAILNEINRLRHHDRHRTTLQRVALHNHLSNERTPRVRTLHLLRRNVLALRQLEQILLSVNDLQAPVRQPHPDIARVEPALLVNGLARLFLVLQVALEDIGTLGTNLALIVPREIPIT